MQIGMRAAERTIALVGDTKLRETEAVNTTKTEVPSGIVHHSKITLCERHDIAVGFAGLGEGSKPHMELAEHLSALDTIPDVIESILTEWADRYFKGRFSGPEYEEYNPFIPICTLLVVNPKTEYCPFWKVRVLKESNALPSSEYLVNGNETNTAIFWPEYFRCDEEVYDLQTATSIAAFTVLMGSRLNPFGVGGLEIWKYQDGWGQSKPTEIEAIRRKFRRFERTLSRSI